MSKPNPYHRYQALGSYSSSVKLAINALDVALKNKDLPDYERAFIEDARRLLADAMTFDKANEAECKALGV